MSTFIEEHVNIDTIHGVGRIYSQELGNKNGKITNTGVKLSSNRALLLQLGVGTTLPVVGEIIPKLAVAADYLSMDVYGIEDSMATILDKYVAGYDIEELGYTNETWGFAPHTDRVNAAMRFVTMKRMKARQALTLDGVSYNSHGMVHSGLAKETQSPIDLNMETGSFGPIDRQLSTFNMAKISREIVGVMFNENDTLCLAVNRDQINPTFRGMIEFEILDSHQSSEYVLERKRLLITENTSNIDYIPVTEGLFIDEVFAGDDIKKKLEVIQSECLSAVVVDDGTISEGEWFAVNKTSHNMRVSLENGQTLSLDPYGLAKTGASQPVSITTFKTTYTRPSTVSGNIEEGLLYKGSSHFDHSLIGNFFMTNVKQAVYKVTPSELKSISGHGSDTFFGPYKINVNLDNIEISQFGDNENAFYALRVSGVDMYMDGDDVYAKLEADLNFTKVVMPSVRSYGKFSVVIGSITFSTEYEIVAGSVHRDKSFMYQSNFMISNDAVVGELIGNVYPVEFFRMERVYKEICYTATEYPLEDGHVNLKNFYEAGEVSIVYQHHDGYMLINNNKFVTDDQITYSYLAFAGKLSDTPMIVESFGYVTRDTMLGIPTEHFLSQKIKDSNVTRTRKRYAGAIEVLTSKYYVMWVKFREVGTSNETFMFEHEYGDEHAAHLGHSAYLNQRTSCQNPTSDGVSKLSWLTNMLKYSLYWSKPNGSIIPLDVELGELTLNKAVGYDQLGVKGSLATKSIDSIEGIRVTALSPQTPTRVTDTSIITAPTVLRADDTLHDRMSIVAVPEIGYCFYTLDDIVFDDIADYSEAEIIDPFKRGITLSWSDHTLDAYLEYRPAETNVFSVYHLKDSDGETISVIEQRFPDGAEGAEYMYEVDNLYARERDFAETYDYEEGDCQKCIPMYLANALMRKFGHVQNIVGVWDEGSSVIINDASISFTDEVEAAGHRITPLCSGAEPIDVVDHYAMISVFKTGQPYDVSDEMRVLFIKSGLIDGFEPGAYAEADALADNGDINGASKRILDGMTSNIHVTKIFIGVSPMLFGMQGPWKNPRDYVTPKEKILLSGELTYKIKKKSRLIMNFHVGPENILNLNEPGRQFDEMYNIIDGYVEEEVVANDKRTPIQRGETTYSISYMNHAGAGILLDRNIVVDLEAYPARLSYPANNLTRELISPIREDAHSKKMDARAVYVRFDTRYVNESIHSYYDKFIEAPTALTCDSLPEEAVLSRDHDNDSSLYENLMTSVAGNSILPNEGVIQLSFDNDTEEDKELTPVFDNHRCSFLTAGQGIASYPLNDAYDLMRMSLLFRGAHEESPDGRDKRDGKFVNTEVEGV